MSGAHPGLAGGPIYLDYNATTPVDPRVVDAAMPYLCTQFGNPSSTHQYAESPRQALAAARGRLARLIGAGSEEIVFTGSGSEANALAIRGAVLAPGAGSRWIPHIVTQETEHPAVLQLCESLQRLHGVDVTYLPVDTDGRVDPQDLARAITDRTVLASIMHANNETGTIQPIRELAEVAHEHGVLFHTDAAQTTGKIRVDVRRLGVDLLTVVGHKMYAPKGIAALYVRAGIRLEPVAYGGGQEGGLRAGTQNVALAVALGAAADLAAADLAHGEPDRLRRLRDDLHRLLDQQLPGTVLLNGHRTERLPNTANLALLPHRGMDLLAATPGIAASTGSACHARTDQPSPVLTAMGRRLPGLGRPGDRARCAVRFSLGRWTVPDDTRQAAQHLTDAATRLRTARSRT